MHNFPLLSFLLAGTMLLASVCRADDQFATVAARRFMFPVRPCRVRLPQVFRAQFLRPRADATALVLALACPERN